jgi:hypothetical protein
MIVDLRDIVALITGLAYPAIILIAILVFRIPLVEFLSRAGAKVKKISVGVFSIELAEARQMETKWTTPNLADVRKPTPSDEFSSSAGDLMTQIRNGDPADYAIINLGDGNKWLSSRIYIFSIILERMRGIRCFVFIENINSTRRRFVGLVHPSHVRWALAHQFPWFESSFVQSCAQSCFGIVNLPTGVIEPTEATNLVHNYLEKIQQQVEPVTDLDEWIRIGNKQRWEHGRYVNGGDIEQYLSKYLLESSVVINQSMTSEEIMQIALTQDGAFVALLNEEKRFQRLLDRQVLLDATVRQIVANAS